MDKLKNLQWDEFRNGAHPEKLPRGVRIFNDVAQIVLCVLSFINPIFGVIGFILALWWLMLMILTMQPRRDILLHIFGMALTVVGLNSLAISFASLILSEAQWIMDVEVKDT